MECLFGVRTLQFSIYKAGIWIFVTIVVQWGWPGSVVAETDSLRVANTSLRLPTTLPVAGYGVTNAFPDLRFDSPVGVKTPPGETNRLFVIERTGRIWAITNLTQPTKELFLDLSNSTFSTYLEAGLLGLAFHPGFATNRYFYLYRTAFTTTAGATNLIHDVISRFEASPADPNIALPESELQLIAQYDDAMEHNAGEVVFGPDGYLYVSFGDASPPPRDRSSDPQAIDKGFFGGIIRIDVDKRPDSLFPNPHPSSTTHYAIPPDNPFIGRTNHNGSVIDSAQVRTEFYAIGFRNPWRMSFDPVTGDLYCGDVGAGDWEEINRVERGGNYGWPYREGFGGGPPPGTTDLPPFYAYGHGYNAGEGRVVVGGVVHRGSTLMELNGAYIFGDYISGNIWMLRHNGTNVGVQRLTAETGISAFGIDPRDGEILLVNYDKGIIEKLAYLPNAGEPGLPLRLSEAGIFADLPTLEPETGILPYEINVPFWSDHAHKRRWFSVPDPAARIGFQSDSPWTFPPGTIWIKHFGLELTNGVPESERRLETRVLVKSADGIYGATYRWDEDQRDATLVPDEGADETFVIHDGGIERVQVWHYPGRQECLFCHTSKAGFALGFNSGQLSRDISSGSNLVNQIWRLGQLNYLDNQPDVDAIRPLAAATNSAYPIGYHVRSYLAANCSQCHQGNPAAEGTLWDARFQTPTSLAGIVDGPLLGNFGEPLNRVISPRSLEHSMALVRLNRRDHYQMPPLATSVIDSNAVALLTDWIMTLPPEPWQNASIGDTGQEGFASVSQETFLVSGAGTGFEDIADGFHFLHQPMQGNVQIIAQIGFTNGPPFGLAGIMLRDGTAANAPFVLVGVRPGGEVVFRSRPTEGMPTHGEEVGTADGSESWLRLLYENNVVSAFHSNDGQEWSLVAQDVVEFGSLLDGGFAVTSGLQTKLATARFRNTRLLGVTIDSPFGVSALAPANIPLRMTLSGETNRVDKITYLADGVEIGTVTGPSSAWVWTNVPAGQYSIRAKVTDSGGFTIDSSPLEISVGLRAARARFNGEDAATRGDWIGSYGSEGALLVAQTNQPPVYSSPLLSGGDSFVWAGQSLDERALRYLESSNRIAAAWYTTTNLLIDVPLNDGHLHQVALYFLDWDGNDMRSQIVEVWDASRGELLDRRMISAFSTGRYLSWQVRGHVKFVILGNSSFNVVLSGIFFDPPANALPEVTLTSTADSILQLPGQMEIVANAFDPDGQIVRVDLFVDGTRLARSTNASLAYNWTNAWAGTHALVARAVDDLGDTGTSEPLQVDVVLPRAGAEFLPEPGYGQGDWIGRYGLDGYVIACHVTNYPPYVTASSGDDAPYIWTQSTSAPAALMQTNLVDRIAACWFALETLDWEFVFEDGMDHKLTLYFLDFEGNGARQSSVDVLDPADEAVLDHQEIAAFSEGKYLSWQVRGRIKIRVTRQTVNAVVSGFFFDPLVADYPAPSLSVALAAGPDPAGATLILQGQPNHPYHLEVSTDLQEWHSYQTLLTPPSGHVSLPVRFAEQPATLFFRGVMPVWYFGEANGTP